MDLVTVCLGQNGRLPRLDGSLEVSDEGEVGDGGVEGDVGGGVAELTGAGVAEPGRQDDDRGGRRKRAAIGATRMREAGRGCRSRRRSGTS